MSCRPLGRESSDMTDRDNSDMTGTTPIASAPAVLPANILEDICIQDSLSPGLQDKPCKVQSTLGKSFDLAWTERPWFFLKDRLDASSMFDKGAEESWLSKTDPWAEEFNQENNEGMKIAATKLVCRSDKDVEKIAPQTAYDVLQHPKDQCPSFPTENVARLDGPLRPTMSLTGELRGDRYGSSSIDDSSPAYVKEECGWHAEHLESENARLAVENILLRAQRMEYATVASCLWMNTWSTAASNWLSLPDVSAGQHLGQGGNGWNKAINSMPLRQRKMSSGKTQAPQLRSNDAAEQKTKIGDTSPLNGGDRTTIMLRNLPNNYSRTMLIDLLDKLGFEGKYDFLYLPIDFKSQASLGYAFVNTVSAKQTAILWKALHGFSQWVLPSQKVCTVAWSDPIQGLQAHIERYRNSPVMHEAVPDDHKPVMFLNGTRVTFPPPTKKLRLPRVRPSGRPGLAALGIGRNSHADEMSAINLSD